MNFPHDVATCELCRRQVPRLITQHHVKRGVLLKCRDDASDVPIATAIRCRLRHRDRHEKGRDALARVGTASS